MPLSSSARAASEAVLTDPNEDQPRSATVPVASDRRSILLFLALAVLYCAVPLTTRGVYYYGDISRAHLAFHAAIARQVRAGSWPIWTDQIFGGMPLLAEGQAGVYYPLNVLFYLPWISIHTSLKISICLHFFLAACFCYYLARKVGQSPWAARFAAVSFAFSGYLVSRLIHQNVFHAAAWLPLVLGFLAVAQAAYNGRVRTRFLLFSAVALGVQALAFYPPITFYTLLAAAAFCVAQPLRPTGQSVGWGRRARDLLIVAIPGICLAAAQIIPTFELMLLSPRGGVGGFEYITQMSLPIKHLPTLVLPNLYGSPASDDYWGAPNFWELCGYAGLLPLLLAIPALVSRPRPRACVFFLFLAALGIVMALGDANPLYRVLPYVPGFNLFKAPARYLVLSTLGFAVLGGFGLQAVLDAVAARSEGAGSGPARLLRMTSRLAIMGGVAFAAAGGVLLLQRSRLTQIAEQRILPGILGAEGRDRPESYYIQQFQARWDGYFWGRVEDLVVAAVMLISVALILRVAERRRTAAPGIGGYLAGAFLGLLLLDLFRFGSAMQPLIDPSFYTSPPELVRAIASDAGGDYRQWRATAYRTAGWEKKVRAGHPGWKGSRDFEFQLREGIPWNLNLFDPGGLRLLEGGTAVPPAHAVNLDVLPPEEAMKQLAEKNVRYVVSGVQLRLPGVTDLATDEGLSLYRLDVANPRALLLPAEGQPLGGTDDVVGIVESSPDNQGQITLLTQSAIPRRLVLQDRFYPGWQTRMDGKPGPLPRPHPLGMSIEVPTGLHTVVFEFRSGSARLGLLISLASVFLVGLLLVLTRSKPRAV